MNVDLEAAKLAAEVADKAKSNFLATVSHEIRYDALVIPLLRSNDSDDTRLAGFSISISVVLITICGVTNQSLHF